MNRKRVILTSIALIAVGVGAYYPLRQVEPVYNEKRLTEWIDQYAEQWPNVYMSSRDAALCTEAQKAIRKIGTNALPAMLSMVAARYSGLRLRFMDFGNRHPVLGIRLPKAEHYQDRAAAAFR